MDCSQESYVFSVLSQCYLDLIILGLKELPVEITASYGEEVEWSDIGYGYRCSFSTEYKLVKIVVNLLQSLYPGHSILYRVSWYRCVINNQGSILFRGAIAYTNDTDYTHFTDRYMCSSYDFTAHGVTSEKALEALNREYIEICGEECEYDEEDLVLTPIVTVGAIDELDFAIANSITCNGGHTGKWLPKWSDTPL